MKEQARDETLDATSAIVGELAGDTGIFFRWIKPSNSITYWGGEEEGGGAVNDSGRIAFKLILNVCSCVF